MKSLPTAELQEPEEGQLLTGKWLSETTTETRNPGRFDRTETEMPYPLQAGEATSASMWSRELQRPLLTELPVLVGKRHNDRILVSVPIRVTGCELSGASFAEETSTVNISRRAACFRLSRALSPGDVVLIKNLRNEHEEKFRVARRCEQIFGNRQEWSVESTRPDTKIWGIEFAQPSDEIQPRVLIECLTCTNTVHSSLSSLEYEALLSVGMISRHCNRCGETTRWKPRAEALDAGVVPPDTKPTSFGRPERKIRLKLAMRVYLRNDHGASDIVQTRDVSKTGLCFVSSREFRVGGEVYIVFPFDEAKGPDETKGKVVWFARSSLGRLHGVSHVKTK
jgi:hypothetical protein